MQRLLTAWIVATTVALGSNTLVNAEAQRTKRPSDATARCEDGTYSYAKQHRGACSGHDGVKTWFR